MDRNEKDVEAVKPAAAQVAEKASGELTDVELDAVSGGATSTASSDDLRKIAQVKHDMQKAVIDNIRV